MRNFEEKRNKKIFEIVVILKIIYIISSAIGIGSVYFENDVYDIVKINLIIVIMVSIAFMYFLWLISRYEGNIDININFIDIIETIILTIIFITVILCTGKNSSGYKLLSIFIVLISSIQFGKSYGLIVSIIQSISIICINITTTNWNKDAISVYFHNDLVLSAALIVTALIIGMYVDTEKEHTKELKELANKDELTGLFNHRYFQDYLTKSIEDAERNDKEISLLFMDIDHFKIYNDINGHLAGDLLLKQMGTILKNNMRENDIVARYGGEEFAVVLPNTTEYDAVNIGERIRKAIQDSEFIGQKNQPDGNVTMSIGVSSYPTRASNKHQLINTADDALYRAKSFNKNRVESYHSVLDDLCKQMEINDDTIKSLKTFINMVNLKDRYTYGHTERVVIYVKWFAKTLNLNDTEQVILQIAAYLHDIGKLEIPEPVLNKKGKLTDEEFQMFRNHPQMGTDLISNIKQFEQFVPLIKHHHERYDGKGYPDKLKGEEIPYLARMLTIADSFDAMTSNRPYNIRKTHEEGIEELKRNTGTQFDPQLTEKFIEMLEIYKDNF